MRRILSDDVSLAVYEDGDPADPTVVLLHGYPDDHRVWDGVVEHLRDRFHVVRYDVRGAGASSAPGATDGYALHHLMADLRAVLDAAKPGARVHLVGHDWGAIQGWEAVLGMPDRFASYTSLGGPGLDHIRQFVKRAPRRHVNGQRLRSWYIGAFQVPFVPELVMRVLPLAGLPAKGSPTFRDDLRNGLGLYRANMAGGGERRDDPTVELPVQLVEPTGDVFVSPALLDAVEPWVKSLWRRKIGSGHWPHHSHPAVIARWIAEFAGHIDAGGPASRSLARARHRLGRKPYDEHLVLVTGAGSGIGRATARAFASHGAEVVCADIDLDSAQRTADEIGKRGGAAAAYAVDVSSEDEMVRLAQAVQNDHGTPDIVVNNAGVAVVGGFFDHSVADWRRILDVNLWGVIHGCRIFGNQMVERGEGGHIVNIASAAAYVPTVHLPAYSVSKAAVKMAGDCLRAEVAGHGIGVTTICPGFIATSIAGRARYVGEVSEEHERRRWDRTLRAAGRPPERVAAHILRAVWRNDPIVPVTAEARVGYLLSRLAPGALRALARLSRAGGWDPWRGGRENTS